MTPARATASFPSLAAGASRARDAAAASELRGSK